LLRDEFRCIALDLPGFGEEPPLEQPSLDAYSNFVWEALSGLGVEQFILIGHSMGAKIALQVAASSVFKVPQQVILVAPSPPTQEPMPDEERQRLLTNHPSEENAATTLDQATRNTLTEEQRSLAIQTHTRAENSAWQWWLKQGMNHSIADQLENIRVPVNVIASPDDPVIPFDTIQQDVVDLMPQAKLIQMDGLGHLIPLEAPEQLAQTIRTTVQQHESA
jgi:pimeloyl-ACP methyl ester carboxylesterase